MPQTAAAVAEPSPGTPREAARRKRVRAPPAHGQGARDSWSAGTAGTRAPSPSTHSPWPASVTGIVLIGDSWWALLLAPLLAVLCARTAFIGHDAGHSQITGDQRPAVPSA